MPVFLSHIKTSGNSDYEKKDKKQMYFLICESCFWCTSARDLYFQENPKCPLCNSYRITLIPILGG